VEGVWITSSDDPGRLVKSLISQYDVPAYVHRGRQVQEAYDSLVARGRRQRAEWLVPVRTRLKLLAGSDGNWSRLRSLLADDDQVTLLRDLHAGLCRETPDAGFPLSYALRRTLRELVLSLERFNQRWSAYLASVDLSPVNEARQRYNRYYVLEKECVVRSPRVACQGFEPLTPVTAADLLVLFPPLDVPRLR
jgi:hypothetical protein